MSKIGSFLLGQMNEADFLTAATATDTKLNQGQHCVAWYFAGMKRLLAKDQPTAIDYFKKCLATDERDYCEYITAQGQLKQLQPAAK